MPQSSRRLPPPEPGTADRAALVLRDGRTVPARRRLADELPVALAFGGRVHTVLMATPRDLEDLARGFALTEDIATGIADIVGLAIAPAEGGLRAELELVPECLPELERRRRLLVAGSACGVCGIGALADAVMAPRQVGRALRVAPAALAAALAALPGHQPLNRATGALHAAAFADASGRVRLAREDVGRHNALDKLVGALAAAGIRPADGFCLITSRCSAEMVQKAMVAGFELLVAVSAPTALALGLAEAAGMTVVAVARGDSQTAFTHPWRLEPP